MAERLEIATALLTEQGSILCHIDENEYERLQLICSDLLLPNAGTIIWDKRNPMLGRKGIATEHEYIVWRTKVKGPLYLRNAKQRMIMQTALQLIEKHGGVTSEARDDFSKWITVHPGLSGGERANRNLSDDGRVYQSVGMSAPELRNDRKFFIPLDSPNYTEAMSRSTIRVVPCPETLKELLDNDEIIFGEAESVQPRCKVFLTEDSQRQVPSVIQETARGKTDMDRLGLEFSYCHPLPLYIELVGAGAPSADSVVLDFFAGSGTNGHAVIALNRDESTKIGNIPHRNRRPV